MSECFYIPSDSLLIGFIEDKDYKLTWWNEFSFFNYKYLLVSAYHNIKYPNLREILKMSNDYVLMGDSGGFQNFSLGATLNPLSVLRWQERNCNIGLTFDFPILASESNEEKRKKQEKTVQHAYFMLNRRVNKNLKLYAVFQGHSIKEQKFIFNEYNSKGELGQFDGYAIGGLVPLKSNIKKLLEILLIFLENVKQFKKPIHIFGLSGRRIMPLIYYISKKYDLDVTYDSSSFAAGSMRREYWVNFIDEKHTINEKTELEKLPCNCVVCKNCNIDYLKKGGIKQGRLLSLHNLLQILKFAKELEESNMNKLKNEFPKLSYYFKLIDYVFKYGMEEGYERCGRKIITEQTIQISLRGRI